jgi:hypothetical protein
MMPKSLATYGKTSMQNVGFVTLYLVIFEWGNDDSHETGDDIPFHW